MTDRFKQNIWFAIYLLLGGLARFLVCDGGLVLCFHRVAKRDNRPFKPTIGLSIEPEFLDRLLTYLRHHKIDVVSLSEALERAQSRHAGTYVSFTFDDGYRDNFDVALPIFVRHRAPFTIFLTTGFIDGICQPWWLALEQAIAHSDSLELPDGRGVPTATGRQKQEAFRCGRDWFLEQSDAGAVAVEVRRLLDRHPGSIRRCEADRAMLSWDMIRRMRDTGLATYGCHTVSHLALSRLDAAAITQEIVGSRDRISEELGSAPSFFAYPYGMPADIGDLAPAIIAGHGLSAAFTTVGKPIERPDLHQPFLLPRISWNGYHQKASFVHAHRLGLNFRLSGLQAKHGHVGTHVAN